MKQRVFELAKQYNMDPKALIDLLKSLGVDGVRNHMSTLDGDVVARVTRHLDPQNPPPWARARPAAPARPDSTRSAPKPQTLRQKATNVVEEGNDTSAAPPPSARPAPRAPDRTNEPRPGETFGTEFLDNMAHQMVAPLQSIEMHCTNMLEGKVPEGKRNQRLGEVVGHARVLTELARRMRFLHELVSGANVASAAEAERLTFVNITTLWIDGFNNYLPQSKSSKIGVDIDTLGMNSLPDVVASPLAVRQVMMNLYDNAFKYGADGYDIKIRAVVAPPFVVNEFSHEARITLTTEAAARVFERGYRAPEARSLRASGTGVGMWISRQLMRSMQGDIRVNPTNRRVTKFVLSWRLA